MFFKSNTNAEKHVKKENTNYCTFPTSFFCRFGTVLPVSSFFYYVRKRSTIWPPWGCTTFGGPHLEYDSIARVHWDMTYVHSELPETCLLQAQHCLFPPLAKQVTLSLTTSRCTFSAFLFSTCGQRVPQLAKSNWWRSSVEVYSRETDGSP